MAFMLIPGYSKVAEIDQNAAVVPDGVNLVVNVAKEVYSVRLNGLPLASRLTSVAIRNKGAELILQSEDFECGEYRLESGCYVVLGCNNDKWRVLAQGVAGLEMPTNKVDAPGSTMVVESVTKPMQIPTQLVASAPKSVQPMETPYKKQVAMTSVKVLKSKDRK